MRPRTGDWSNSAERWGYDFLLFPLIPAKAGIQGFG